ncbi:MAG: amidohydrolase, partial [bacterium]|nr:amidohydrolase [bacterium]
MTISCAGPAPDLIVNNGKVVTVDDEFSIAEAMAVTADSVVAVGSNAEILALAGTDTEQLDLEGKMVLPGLIDSHVHAPGA